MNRNATNNRQQQQQQQTGPMIKMQFEQLGKVIGKAWRALPKHQNRILDTQAELNRERYNKEMIVYHCENRQQQREDDDNEMSLLSTTVAPIHHQYHHALELHPHPVKQDSNTMIRAVQSMSLSSYSYSYQSGCSDNQGQPQPRQVHIHPQDQTATATATSIGLLPSSFRESFPVVHQPHCCDYKYYCRCGCSSFT